MKEPIKRYVYSFMRFRASVVFDMVVYRSCDFQYQQPQQQRQQTTATANHELETTEMLLLHQICQAIKFIAFIDR